VKILLVLEAALGGAGRHVLDLAEGLIAGGHEVHLVWSPLRADRSFRSRLESLNAGTPRLHSQRVAIARAVRVSDVSSYLALSRYVHQNGPFDVIHAHSTKAGFLARLLLNRRNAATIYTSHGLMTLDPTLTGFRRRAVCVLETTLARRSEAVIAVSSSEFHCATESGINSAKLSVIPNGIAPVDTDFYKRQRTQIRATLGLSADIVCIGFVGRFFWYKQPARLIEAFALLKRRTTNPAYLVMAGWGSLDSELHRQAVDLGMEKDVRFVGEVDGPGYIPAFDILANSSLFEGMSYVFLEALSSGVPVVTTRVGGTDELISNGVTGYVCDPWEPSAFAEYLKLLVEDPHLRSAMSAAARERAAHYSVDKMVDSVAELYLHLSARPHLATAISANQQTL
jgi:glycosyltransferase involved in cell wall biosynthesis